MMCACYGSPCPPADTTIQSAIGMAARLIAPKSNRSQILTLRAGSQHLLTPFHTSSKNL